MSLKSDPDLDALFYFSRQRMQRDKGKSPSEIRANDPRPWNFFSDEGRNAVADWDELIKERQRESKNKGICFISTPYAAAYALTKSSSGITWWSLLYFICAWIVFALVSLAIYNLYHALRIDTRAPITPVLFTLAIALVSAAAFYVIGKA